MWLDKVIIWKDLSENQVLKFAEVEELLQDKVKAVVETVVKVNLNEKKKFFSGDIT